MPVLPARFLVLLSFPVQIVWVDETLKWKSSHIPVPRVQTPEPG